MTESNINSELYKSMMNELLIKSQIEGIQKEVQNLKVIYFNTIADFRFDCIRNKHEWDAEETTSSSDKLEIYKAMYQEIIEYLSEESEVAHRELMLKYYSECSNLPEELEYQSTECFIDDSEGYPFD